MARRRKKQSNGNPGQLTRTAFCPQCETMMNEVKKKHHQRGFDLYTKEPLFENGKPVLVTRVFYGCSKCETIIWFDYREDGKRGQLNQKLAYEKKHGIKGDGLGGSSKGLIDL